MSVTESQTVIGPGDTVVARLGDSESEVCKGYIQQLLPDQSAAEVYVEQLCKMYVPTVTAAGCCPVSAIEPMPFSIGYNCL